MKISYYILLFLDIFLSINSTEFNFCCCLFSKDPFRGFQSTASNILSFDITIYQKDEIGNKILAICHDGLNGFPSSENIERIKRKETTVNKEECAKECSYLMRELNEQYNIKQEENREKEAKLLREKRRKLLKMLDGKIMENVDSMHKGEKCKYTVRNKNNKGKNFSKPSSSTRKVVENMGSNDISFDSMTEVSNNNEDQVLDNLEMGNLNGIQLTSRSGNSNLIVPTISTFQFEKPDLNLEKELDKLDNHIMYLEKKNKRPIDFILDRFNMQDDILVIIIKIFEGTLDDAIKKMKNYFEDTIYFQFNIAEKLKIGSTKNI